MSYAGPARRRGDYNDTVRRYFGNPAHGGDLPAGSPPGLSAAVTEGGAGARLTLEAAIEGDRIRCLRYRVFGCPHLVAAAEMLAEHLEGGPVAALADVPVDDLIERLEVPVEKTGRILLLEDACLALAQKHRQALENGG